MRFFLDDHCVRLQKITRQWRQQACNEDYWLIVNERLRGSSILRLAAAASPQNRPRIRREVLLASSYSLTSSHQTEAVLLAVHILCSECRTLGDQCLLCFTSLFSSREASWWGAAACRDWRFWEVVTKIRTRIFKIMTKISNLNSFADLHGRHYLLTYVPLMFQSSKMRLLLFRRSLFFKKYDLFEWKTPSDILSVWQKKYCTCVFLSQYVFMLE